MVQRDASRRDYARQPRQVGYRTGWLERFRSIDQLPHTILDHGADFEDQRAAYPQMGRSLMNQSFN
jgi:hypothetical protein